MALILNTLFSIIIALICVLIALIKWYQTYWERRNFNYIKPTFLFGNLQNAFSKNRKQIGVQVLDLYKEARAKGWKHCGIYFLSSPTYFVLDLEYIKNILLKDFNYFTDKGLYYNEKVDPISGHLFSVGGIKWRNLRRKLTPTFTSGKMKIMFHILVDCGKHLEEVMEKIVEKKEPLDIKEIAGQFTTDIIGSCAFGLECGTFDNPNSPFRTYAKKIFDRTRLETVLKITSTSFPLLGNILKLRQISKDCSEFYSKIVMETIEHRFKNKTTRQDFLQLLIEMKSDSDEYKGDGNTLTLTEIVAQCFMFFIAGFETSSTTMTFCLLNLAQNLEIQDRVREEIRRVLEKHDGITYDGINEMTYLGQIVDETLRMYPPVNIITRQCVEDYKIPDEDFVIEKGTRVAISALGLHYDEQYFPNAEVFDPERFSEENKPNIPHYAYLPFGEGNRICIGMRFGLMQTKVGLCSFLKNYKFTLNEKTKMPVTLDPVSLVPVVEGGVWLNCEKIN